MSRLWYREPAKVWEEALPLGNGRMGAMIFGGICQERIQVNEETMWFGAANERMNPDARHFLPDVREYIFDGQIAKAQKLLNMAFAGCPDSMKPYQTLGDIRLEFEGQGETADYERSLDLEDAVCRIRYRCGGVSYRREAFLSHPDDCLVMRFSADCPGRITFTAKLERGRFFDGVGKLGENGIWLYGNLGKGGVDFAAGLKAYAVGGTTRVIGQTLYVENADEAILLFCADTTYHHREMPGEKNAGERRGMLLRFMDNVFSQTAEFSFETLMQRHRADYETFYKRVDFQLAGCEEYDAVPTDERLRLAGEGNADIGLSKLIFDFGRYLLISCSRPEGLPATLQGIWNQDFLPPWDSKYTININAEMNYWLAESCNLPECHLPLFTLLEKMRESGRKMAAGMYGCRGFVAHHNTDIHGDCAPQDTWFGSTYWVMGAAWLCTHIWNHYEYTGDREFLIQYYPVLCEAVLFFLDYLVEKDGYLVTCPSSSPENVYRLPNGESGAVTYGATMDNQILRDLFGQCLLASEVVKADSGRNSDGNSEVDSARSNVRNSDGNSEEDSARSNVRNSDSNSEKRAQELKKLGIEDEEAFLAAVRRTMERLIPNRISRSGTIMEWVEEYEECEPGHRHISHLYGLHPSNQITVDGTPELAEAARKTLESRLSCGGGHTGWSRAWIINHYAKLWDGEKAYHNLEQLLAISTYPNLFDRHPPFQIDGNFGAAAAIAEMLVQSSSERIVLLPALPDAWRSGSIHGLKIRGNGEIDIEWKEHRLTGCTVRAKSAMKNRLLYHGKYYEFTLAAGQEFCLQEE